MEGTSVYRLEEEDGRIAVHTGKDTCYARMVVGADGVNSKVAVCCGLLKNREAGVALEAEVEVSSATLQNMELRFFLTSVRWSRGMVGSFQSAIISR